MVWAAAQHSRHKDFDDGLHVPTTDGALGHAPGARLAQAEVAALRYEVRRLPPAHGALGGGALR